MSKKAARKLARRKHRVDLGPSYRDRARETIAMLRKQEQPAEFIRSALRELRHKFTRTIKTLSRA